MIPREIRFEFVRSSGPGGQNVNKVATAVQLRFDLRGTRSLAPEVRDRLARLEANRVNAAGELVILARRFRSQERNRQDALDRLERLIARAAEPPRKRTATRAPRSADLRRLDAKRRRAAVKGARARVAGAEE